MMPHKFDLSSRPGHRAGLLILWRSAHVDCATRAPVLGFTAFSSGACSGHAMKVRYSWESDDVTVHQVTRHVAGRADSVSSRGRY